MKMKTITKAAILATGMLVATPVMAARLTLYDFDAAQGARVAASPYADQEIARLTRMGQLRGVTVPLDDGGVELRTSIDVLAPFTVPRLGFGQSVLTGSVTWEMTTRRIGDQFSYHAVIRTRRAYENGRTAPTDETDTRVDLEGTAPMASGHSPAFSRRYATPAGERMLVGIVQP